MVRASQRPGSDRPKRPWYLVLALAIAWLFGAAGFYDGCMTMSFYHADSVDPAVYVRDVKDDDQRKIVEHAAESLIETTTLARERAFPLAVGAFLLGAVMIAFAARALAGRAGARGPLIQLVAVQAALAILTFVLTPDIRHARVELAVASFDAQLHDKKDAEPAVIAESEAWAAAVFRHFDVSLLGTRTALALFVLFALTRPRSRAFYDAAQERLSRR